MWSDSLRQWLAGRRRTATGGAGARRLLEPDEPPRPDRTGATGAPILPPDVRALLSPLPVNTPDGPVAERVVSRRLAGRGGSEGRPLRAQVLLRNQVLRFSMPPRVGLAARFAFRENPPDSVPWRAGDEGSPARLLPRLRPCPQFVSAGELVVKAKTFDDGLLAAVEAASQEACGTFQGKRPLLRALRETLTGNGTGAALVDAACEVGGLGACRTPDAAEVARHFLAEGLQSKPVGFYTWSEELGRIFRQDRLLQRDLGGAGDAERVALALTSAPDLFAAYRQCLRLAERATNRLACTDFRPWIEAIAAGGTPPGTESEGPSRPPLALFPASRSHEADLARRLYEMRWIPEDADLLRDLIRAVRSGELDLRPGNDSGWYDWLTWAIETLVSPERAEEAPRVSLDESYRCYLEDIFRAALALGRETHVKQLEIPAAGCAMLPPVIVHPDLRLEPLVSHYVRRAEGYRFIRDVLGEFFGMSALVSLRRLRSDGPIETPLAAELDFMIALFDGAANVARLELGAPAQGDTDAFVQWMQSRGQDPDITADLRMMVPVYHDAGRDRTKVWMFLGWMEDSIDVAFASPPEVRSLSGGRLEARLESSTYPIAKPVVVEALVSRLLDRDEFRALCDRHATPEAIIRAAQ